MSLEIHSSVIQVVRQLLSVPQCQSGISLPGCSSFPDPTLPLTLALPSSRNPIEAALRSNTSYLDGTKHTHTHTKTDVTFPGSNV